MARRILDPMLYTKVNRSPEKYTLRYKVESATISDGVFIIRSMAGASAIPTILKKMPPAAAIA